MAEQAVRSLAVGSSVSRKEDLAIELFGHELQSLARSAPVTMPARAIVASNRSNIDLDRCGLKMVVRNVAGVR
jgi:hypothetical protein